MDEIETQNTNRKLLLALGLPFLLVFGVALALYSWDRGALPFVRPESVPVTPATITRDHRGVLLEGTAHHTVRLLQRTEGAEDWYLVPVFERGDTMGRDAHVLWRTQRPPDDLISYEDVAVEGFARPPGALVPRQAQEALEQRGYSLTKDYVLVEEYSD